MKSNELIAIETFYGNRTSARSKVPLIKHIHDGIRILESIDASEEAKRAFCLHPLTQGNYPIPDICKNLDIITLAHQYASVANSYLCNKSTDHITSVSKVKKHLSHILWTDDLINMLIADKFQNRSDFIRYHKDTHVRSKQLDLYFELWLTYLFEMKP